MRRLLLLGGGLFVLLGGAALYYIRHQAPSRDLVRAKIEADSTQTPSQTDTKVDSHRPPCNDAGCQKIESFLKARYCINGPFGNGPDNGCDFKPPDKPQNGDVLADYHCEYIEKEDASRCEQRGEPSPDVRKILVDQLHTLGLPPNVTSDISFVVWRESGDGWTVAHVSYSHTIGLDLELCEAIVLIDRNSHAIAVRKLPFAKTNVDVPDVTTWGLVDIADVDGDGRADIILDGEGYENHWLEVVSFREGVARTVFSGLGYYL